MIFPPEFTSKNGVSRPTCRMNSGPGIRAPPQATRQKSGARTQLQGVAKLFLTHRCGHESPKEAGQADLSQAEPPSCEVTVCKSEGGRAIWLHTLGRLLNASITLPFRQEAGKPLNTKQKQHVICPAASTVWKRPQARTATQGVGL